MTVSEPLYLLLWLLVVVVVIYVIYLILGNMALPPTARPIVYLIVGILLLLWLLRILGFI